MPKSAKQIYMQEKSAEWDAFAPEQQAPYMVGGHKYQAALEKYNHGKMLFEEAGGWFKPKKPTNAWDMFCSLHRNRVTKDLKTEHGENYDRGLVTKELGQEYRALSDDEKKALKEKVDAAKEKYKEKYKEDLVKYKAFKRKSREYESSSDDESSHPQKRQVFL